MASIAHADDRVHLNKLDMYTWTGTFGMLKDGFPKTMPIDGTYVTQMDETPTEYPPMIDSEDVDHFNPERLNMSGPMYVKECSVKPAPYRMFPARKFEYPSGKVTWDRPGLTMMKHQYRSEGGDKLVWVILIVIVLLIVFRNKLKILKS
jgi:hypothetical protein